MAEVKLTVLGEDKSGPVQQGLLNTEKAIGMVKAAAVALGISFSAMMVVDYAKDATLLAARYNTLGVTMQVVGNNAGYSGEQMKGFETQLRATGIAMVEARQNLTSMSQAQIDLSKSTQLARIAQDAAVIGGINSSEAFSRMVYGIQSAQVDVLRTIGLNVSFEDSYKKLGKQLGKNAEDLTELEKVQARTNAVMEKGKDITGAYEAAMGTAGKQISSMKRYMDDLKVKVGEVFQDALTVAVGWATDGLKGLNKEAEDLAKKKQLDTWGRDALMAMAFAADGVQGVILLVKTLTESLIWSGKTLYGWAGIASNALTLNFSNVGAWWNWMNKNTSEYSASMEKTFGNVKSFQDQAKGYLDVKDAALKNVDALKAQEEARMKAGAASRAQQEATAKQEASEKRFMADLKNNITGIKEYSSALKDLGKERLAVSSDRYQEKMKAELELYKSGGAALDQTIKPLRLYNTQINSVYNERLVNERSALNKITGLYSEFRSKITITANAKEVKQQGVEILREVKSQAAQIIAVETERYKTLLAGEQAYASQVLSLIQAKKNEIKELQSRFEDANKSFEEKKRSALGDYSGGYGYLDPNLDALGKRQEMVKKLQADELAYDEITDPAKKKEKLLGLIDAWGQLDKQIDLAGQTVITKEQAIGEVQAKRIDLQEKILANAEKEKNALDDVYSKALSRIDQYKQKIVQLDDLLISLNRDITINLNVNGIEQLNRIQGVVNSATASPFSSGAASSGSAVDPNSYYQSGDSMYWGDGSYAGPAFERGTDYVPRTGIALVHQGEKITPAGQSDSGVTFGDINITVQGGGNPAEIGREVTRQLYTQFQTMNSRKRAA